MQSMLKFIAIYIFYFMPIPACLRTAEFVWTVRTSGAWSLPAREAGCKPDDLEVHDTFNVKVLAVAS